MEEVFMDNEKQKKAQRTSKRRTRSNSERQTRKTQRNNSPNTAVAAEEQESSLAAGVPDEGAGSNAVPNQLRTAFVSGKNKKGASLGNLGSIQEAGKYINDFNAALNSVAGNIDNVIGKYESMAKKVKGAFDNVVEAVGSLKTAWSTAVEDFSKADSIGEKIKAAWGGANKVLEESKNCLNTMKESSDTFSKSMKEVGSLGKKMKIPGLDKVGKFAGPFNKLSGASGKLGGALKGLGGAMGAIDAIVQTWQTGWNLGKKLGEMLGLAKIFHNALYGKQAEADKKKMADADKKIKAIKDTKERSVAKWLLENEGAAAVEEYRNSIKKQAELRKKSADLKKGDPEKEELRKEIARLGNIEQSYIDKVTFATTKDPKEKERLKKKSASLRKMANEAELQKKHQQYSVERKSSLEEGKRMKQQYYINSAGLTPQQQLQKQDEYYNHQMQNSKKFEAEAEKNYKDAEGKGATMAMRNFGREGEQERARQVKIANQQSYVKGWIKDYKDLDEISKRQKPEEKITGYLDKIARNVIKIDQHTYGTKSNTESMLRQMGHTDSITL
jgi:hypothetical protein